MGARAEFVFVREKDDAGMQGDWALVTMRAGSDSAMVLALPDPPSDLEAPRMSGRKLDAGVGGAGFLGIGHLSAAALLCSRGGCVCVGGGGRPWSGRRWRRRGGRREGLLCAAGGHSGYARCATPCRGAPFFAWTAQGGAAGAGDAVSARRVAGSGVPLIVQPQSERVVSAGTSARKNSWPLCLHARGPHAGHTQTRAHASRCVTVERASTGVCVHHARVSWISKQPGVICPS